MGVETLGGDPGRPLKDDEPRSTRKYVYITASLNDRVSACRDSFSDLVNRLLRAHFQSKDADREVAALRARLEKVRELRRPLDEEEEELVVAIQSLEHQRSLEEFQADQEEAWRSLVRQGPDRSPAQWRSYAEARPEADAVGMDRALEIVGEERGVAP